MRNAMRAIGWALIMAVVIGGMSSLVLVASCSTRLNGPIGLTPRDDSNHQGSGDHNKQTVNQMDPRTLLIVVGGMVLVVGMALGIPLGHWHRGRRELAIQRGRDAWRQPREV